MTHPDYPTHPERDEQNQSIHDGEIRNLANELRDKGFKVFTNPGTSKENPIKRNKRQLWPDIIVVENNRATHIYEVEAEDTVTAGSVAQWKDYAAGASDFYLVVPENSYYDAKNLVTQNDVNCKEIITY